MTKRTVIAGLLLCVSACMWAPPPPPYDLLILNGTVVDGTGTPPQVRNIAILNGRIADLDAAANAPATATIDATNRMVVPGFIDPHTHALRDLLSNETAANANYLFQGVTTVVVGNDGDGVSDHAAKFATLKAQGIGNNMAFFAGHGAARKAVMGMANRAPDDTEMRAMEDYVDVQMRAGALGLSSGLYYAPGSYAKTAEVVRLARVAARYGGVYDTHLRDEGVTNIGVTNAVSEAIEIGRAAGIPVHISHIKALGPDVWGRSEEIINLINAARAQGIDVTANQYPWEASGTRFSNALIPRWVMADSREARDHRLRDPALKSRLRQEMAVNLERRAGPGAMLVTGDSEFQGLTLRQIADKTGLEPLDAAIKIVLDGDPSIASFIMSPQDIRAFSVQPWVMTGSDGSNGHPRKYATYPKAYKDLVIDNQSHSMAGFVRRSSAQVAEMLGLCNRGYIKLGYVADITVLDPAQYLVRASYQQPKELATGVDYLIVDGVEVIANKQLLPARPGAIINRHQQDCPDEQ